MKKVLLIDDDPINNFVNRKLILKLKGDCEIIEFLNAEDALKYLEENQADVIFLDLAMPYMDGWAFLDEYMEKKYSYPVFVLTTSIDPDDKIKAQQYPVIEGFFVKPLTIKETEAALAC